MKKIILALCFMTLTAAAFAQPFNNNVVFQKKATFLRDANFRRDTVYFGNGTDSVMVYVYNDSVRFICVTCSGYKFVPPLVVSSVAGTPFYIGYFGSDGILTGDAEFRRNTLVPETFIEHSLTTSSDGINWYSGFGMNIDTTAFPFVFAQVSHGNASSFWQIDTTNAYMASGKLDSNSTLFIHPSKIGFNFNFNTNQDVWYVPNYSDSGKFMMNRGNGEQCVWENPFNADASVIPEYPDNATAVAILGAGRLYFTTVSGEHIVKITY
jgi:hypothetical protein